MNKIFYQNRKDKIDNIRESLRVSYDRCNQLVTINNQAIGLVVAILIGLITFLGSSYFTSQDPNRYLTIIIAIHISIVTLIFWRYYAHIIDNDIANSYSKIVFAENKLNIPFELTFLCSIEKSQSLLNLINNESYKKLNFDERSLVIQELIKKNRIGYRYHDLLDFLAVGLTSLLLVFQLGFVITEPIPSYLYFGFLVYLPIVYDFSCYGLAFDLRNGIPIQRDPTEKEINEIVRNI